MVLELVKTIACQHGALQELKPLEGDADGDASEEVALGADARNDANVGAVATVAGPALVTPGREPPGVEPFVQREQLGDLVGRAGLDVLEQDLGAPRGLVVAHVGEFLQVAVLARDCLHQLEHHGASWSVIPAAAPTMAATGGLGAGMGSSNEEQPPFQVEWKDDGFVASMDDTALFEARDALGILSALAIGLVPLFVFGIPAALDAMDDQILLGYWVIAMPAFLAFNHVASRPQRAVLECGPERVAISRTLRRRRSLDTRRITEVIPAEGGLYVATDARRVWVPCPDAHYKELIALLTEALRRYASFEEDMAQPEVKDASEQARSIVARKSNVDREGESSR